MDAESDLFLLLISWISRRKDVCIQQIEGFAVHYLIEVPPCRSSTAPTIHSLLESERLSDAWRRKS